MCRSIKVLRTPEAPATPEEISAAPSKVNQAVFDAAVIGIAKSTERFLTQIRREKRPNDHH